MYLKSLVIESIDSDEIRTIEFKVGVNIILGSRVDKVSSTNSLGKTTLLRAIDFCLGGDYKSFFKDEENKSNNETVLDFLKTKQPIFKLTVVDDLESEDSKKIEIKRELRFKPNKKNINGFQVLNFVENKKVASSDFDQKLKEILFNLSFEKPSFRQLITKFIRKNDQQISFILRYLFPTTSNLEYEILHFCLFGYSDFTLVENKKQIEDRMLLKDKEISFLSDLKPQGADQIVGLNENLLGDLYRSRDSFQINEAYNDQNQLLVDTRSLILEKDALIGDVLANMQSLESRYDLLNSQKIDHTDANYIELMYKEANYYNINIHKKFEETVNFHNQMLLNEMNYLKKEILKKNEVIQSLNMVRESLNFKYSELLEELSQQGSLAEYTRINDEITKLSVENERIKVILDKIRVSEEERQKIQEELEETLKKIDDNISKFKKERIDIFNEYFSKYSVDLYKQRNILSFECKEGIYHFNVIPQESNAGSGKRQNLVSVFDLAYSAFIQDERVNLPYPNFFTQDKVEIIDASDFSKLQKICQSSKSQFIFPMIEDKFNTLKLTKESVVILEIDEKNKFFNIESI
ncbi:AAA family ATPase [Acinetobacter chinensis]|uniref:AAA family ATPase n=1 Tax=Acinetobacter chinensis TaxID=2004650 RepID=UPI002934EB86|nr:AAA family ATPase [Acinetobacter chinensis]WOE40812.1 AAA family ATPase [Acinetobacter chinensis]